MSKTVRLTWRDDDGNTYIEDCLLLEEDDHVCVPSLDGGLTFTLEIKMDDFARHDLVVFEDEEGLFILKTENVLNIQVL